MKSTNTRFAIATLLGLASLPLYSQSPGPSTSSTPNSSISSRSVVSKTNSFHPTGFMDIPFGTVLDSATSMLKAKNYRFQTIRGWQIKISGPFDLAGASATEAQLSFNPDAGFFEGYVIVQGKDTNDTNSQYDRLLRIIETKYRTKPIASKRESGQGGKRYWMDEWAFSTEQGTYSIKMIRDKDKIHMTYKADRITPQQPSTGGVSESGL